MTEAQKQRIAVLMDHDDVVSVSAWQVPEGSVLVSRTRRDGGTWVELLEPSPTCMLAWDLG
jgi:hypothetical protein